MSSSPDADAAMLEREFRSVAGIEARFDCEGIEDGRVVEEERV